MSIIDFIGNTPLVELKRVSDNIKNIKIFAKCEFMNVSGSVKDRPAKAMILDGISSGKLTDEKVIIDATSGNTGIAYSVIGASMGYRVKLAMPENVTAERQKYMKSLGAEIILTDVMEGIDGSYELVNKIVNENPEKYFYPNQYKNNCNWLAHYNGTAEEIISQTNGTVTHFVAGTGTSGTFMGCTRKLKEYNSNIKCYNMTPDSPFHGIEGVKYCSCLLSDGFYDESISDGRITVTTEEAFEMSRKIAKSEGLFVGMSSGANVSATLKLAETVPEGSVIVTVLCDSGSRYFYGSLWS